MNRRTMGAWTTAGVAMWASLGTLDVTGAPAGVERVAMLPGLGTLAAAVALALVLGALVTVRVRAEEPPSAAAAPRPPRPRGTGDSFLPLYALAVLVLPYLPWLPDRVPALQIFAGPGKLLVWLVVVSQVVWAILGAGRGRRIAVLVHAWPLRRAFGVVFVASLAAYGVASLALIPSGLFPSGDEPHYLVLTQSLLKDHDLRIDNNHAQRDWEAYFDGDLELPANAPAAGGAAYSVHPIGLPLVAAPAFAVAGYRGVVLLLLILASATAAVAWTWVRRATGSVSAATFAWAAVALSLPVLASAGTVFPEVPAALALMVAAAIGIGGMAVPGSIGKRPSRAAFWSAIGIGVSTAALPWLHARYAPASGILLLVGVWRLWRETTGPRPFVPIAIAVSLYAASVLGWFGYCFVLWGSPWPTAPFGGPGGTPMSLAGLARGLPGLLFDQEYGILSYAPALGIGFLGFWTLWRSGGRARGIAVELAVTLAALFLTAGACQMWWGGSALPGRLVQAGIPLLTLPAAWAFRAAANRPDRRAAYRLFLLVGLGITLACVLVREGRLLGLERTGFSPFLEWLSPDWHLWAFFPDFVTEPAGAGLARIAMWTTAAALALWLVARAGGRAAASPGSTRTGRGLAFLRVDAASVLTLLAVTLAGPALLGDGLKPSPIPEDRERIPLLDEFDPEQRPIGIRYAPFSLIPAGDVPRLFVMSARPGSRRSQPSPVLLNARFALPAGRYQVELHARPDAPAGTALSGELALRVGRTGGSPTTWPVQAEPGRPWTTDFDLPVDVNFVGFRASEGLEGQVGQLRLRPRDVVGSLHRVAAFDVLGTWARGPFVFLFHDDLAYPEPDGFWVRGAGRVVISVVSRTGPVRSSFRLRLRSEVANTVRVDTTDQHWTLQLAAGQPQEIELTPNERDGALRIVVTPATGFRPSDRDPANGDRRFLGCWIEIAP